MIGAEAAIATTRFGLGPKRGDLAEAAARTTWQIETDGPVVVVTEFGRTVAENGTGGTDHGTAGIAFLLGDAVDGGRVVARWPGLSQANLFEGRDLTPTLDLRSVLKGALAEHLGLSNSALDRSVFPDSAAAPPLRDLVRA